MKSNVILIGMSGAGKSTLGVLLAKALGMSFADTDILIQRREGMKLQEIIDLRGSEAFLRCEEELLCSLELSDTVIATGGSAVYSEKGMSHLKKKGTAVYLRVEKQEILRRLTDITTRGIVLKGTESIAQLYDEREPLYVGFADLTLDCTGRSVERCVEELVKALGE